RTLNPHPHRLVHYRAKCYTTLQYYDSEENHGGAIRFLSFLNPILKKKKKETRKRRENEISQSVCRILRIEEKGLGVFRFLGFYGPIASRQEICFRMSWSFDCITMSGGKSSFFEIYI
ncbi:hypothetical protein CEXT_339051, partial [Caerostris extrusa]